MKTVPQVFPVSKAIAVLCTALLLALSIQQEAFAKEASILEKFEGEWASDGDAFGRDAESLMVWSQELDARFYRLDYKIRMPSESGSVSQFEGIAYYRQNQANKFSGFWADSSGDLHPIVATELDSSLTAIWGVEGAKMGRTQYKLVETDAILVTDWIKTPEDWKKFNQNTFLRVKNPD